MTKHWKILFISILCVLTAACTVGSYPQLKIAPVELYESLPTLIQRETVTISTYEEVIEKASEVTSNIEELGGQIDIGINGYLDCEMYFNLYQQAAALPILSTNNSDPLRSWGINEYNGAIDNMLETTRDTYNHCEAFMLGETTNDEVAALSWSRARQGVNESVEQLNAITKRLQEELPDTTLYIGTGGKILKETRIAMDYIGDLGYEIDKRLVMCSRFIELYEEIQQLPEFEVTDSDPAVQAAYVKYRWAIDETVKTSHSQYLDCQDFLVQENLTRRPIPDLTWTISRKGIADSMAALHQVEEWLKDYER